MALQLLVIGFVAATLAARTVDSSVLIHSEVSDISPIHFMHATCRFEDTLVVISETMDKLTIRLADFSDCISVRRSSPPTLNDEVRQSIKSLNDDYRSQVARLVANDTETRTQDPVEVLERFRRDIKQTLESVVESVPSEEDIYVSDSDEDFDELHNTTEALADDDLDLFDLDKVAAKWRSQMQNCLEQYRALQRIILFENFIKRAFDKLHLRLADSNLLVVPAAESEAPKSGLPCWIKVLQVQFCKMVGSLRSVAEQVFVQRFYLALALFIATLLIMIGLLKRSQDVLESSTSAPLNKK